MLAKDIAFISGAMAIAAPLIGNQPHQADSVIRNFGNIFEIGKKARECETRLVSGGGGGLCECIIGGGLCRTLDCSQSETKAKTQRKTDGFG